jgi:hypothetical protein
MSHRRLNCSEGFMKRPRRDSAETPGGTAVFPDHFDCGVG